MSQFISLVFGYQDTREARYLEKKEGHTRRKDSESVGVKQLHDYNTFMDLGLGAATPSGYQRI